MMSATENRLPEQPNIEEDPSKGDFVELGSVGKDTKGNPTGCFYDGIPFGRFCGNDN